MPGDSLPSTSFFSKIPYFDKIVHFMMYFILAFFLMSGILRQYGKTSAKAYISSFTVAFLFGIMIECMQEKVGRSFDVYDMIANTLGVIVSLLLFNTVERILRNWHSSTDK
jgi:VanZ family protein